MNLQELLELRTKLEHLKRENLSDDREIVITGDTILLIGDVILRMERDDKWRPYVDRKEN